MASKTKKGPTLASVNLREAQDQATKLFKTARKQVEGYLPEGSRKQLSKLEARVERAGKDFEKARDRALKQVRTRVEAFLGDVEKTAMDVVKPIVTRLDIASKAEVSKLQKRVADLEKRVVKHDKHDEHAAA